jgi:hypothetical protein
MPMVGIAVAVIGGRAIYIIWEEKEVVQACYAGRILTERFGIMLYKIFPPLKLVKPPSMTSMILPSIRLYQKKHTIKVKTFNKTIN